MLITTTKRAGSNVRLNGRERLMLTRSAEILRRCAAVETDKHGKKLAAETAYGAIESYLNRELEP